MKVKYDQIGIDYAGQRKSDPRIAAQIHEHLKGADKILNIGAGTGSYEPEEADLIALEPSSKMIEQRNSSHPVIQASAEELPFEDKHFSHTMTVLSMHHWTDQVKAFKEISRVTKEKFVAVSWNPESAPFWLTEDYFPEIYQTDLKIFPFLNEIKNHFTKVKIEPLLIPADCIDGFLAAYWKRPEAYLDPRVRQSISTFSKLENIEEGLLKLNSDLEDGTWARRNALLLDQEQLDTGYVIVLSLIHI